MKKFISYLVIICLLLQLFGCYSMQTISPTSLNNQSSNPHLIIALEDGSRIEFIENSYTIFADTIKGAGNLVINKTDRSEPIHYNIPVSSVKYASIEQYDTGSTLLVSGLIIGIVVFVASTKIPFINN